MFGLLISGRTVLGPPETISPTQYAFTIPSTPHFSHLGVFLLPATTFPAENVGATVWFSVGNSGFRFLGALAPAKPSAIFKLSDSGANNNTQGGQIVIGISIESAEQVEAQIAKAAQDKAAAIGGGGASGALVRSAGSPSAVTTKILAQRIIGNAFNFLSSFNGETVPLRAFRDWWEKFEKKVSLDPGFLEREQD